MLVTIWERIFSILIYMLPWSDSLPFSNYLLQDWPFLSWLYLPIYPIVLISKSIPFGSLIIFFSLFTLIIRNPKISYFLRFNALQAILLDIVLLLLDYGSKILIKPIGSALVASSLLSSIFIITLSVIIFAIFECMQGKEPNIPGISEAVRIQL